MFKTIAAQALKRSECGKIDKVQRSVGVCIMLKIDKVLIVDDDDYIRRIAEIALKKVGKWDVQLAKCGADALTVAREQNPDIILMDVTMPDLDGPATFAKLRECEGTASIPVIFLTGRVQPDELTRFNELGVNGVINKPFDPMKLPEQICQMLGLEPRVI